jgi:hypothetical protein
MLFTRFGCAAHCPSATAAELLAQGRNRRPRYSSFQCLHRIAESFCTSAVRIDQA